MCVCVCVCLFAFIDETGLKKKSGGQLLIQKKKTGKVADKENRQKTTHPITPTKCPSTPSEKLQTANKRKQQSQ